LSWTAASWSTLRSTINEVTSSSDPRAAKILAEIYNWFAERFDTADLKDAKALLAELNE
jgi:hypothetical protein